MLTKYSQFILMALGRFENFERNNKTALAELLPLDSDAEACGVERKEDLKVKTTQKQHKIYVKFNYVMIRARRGFCGWFARLTNKKEKYFEMFTMKFFRQKWFFFFSIFIFVFATFFLFSSRTKAVKTKMIKKRKKGKRAFKWAFFICQVGENKQTIWRGWLWSV